jgi:hypothetical protein
LLFLLPSSTLTPQSPFFVPFLPCCPFCSLFPIPSRLSNTYSPTGHDYDNY